MSQLKVIIHFENEEVSTAFPSEDYLFKDLDAWIRSRFGVVEKESLRYMNSLGEGKRSSLFSLLSLGFINYIYFFSLSSFLVELLPTKSYLQEESRVYVKKIKTGSTRVPTIWGMTQWQFSLVFLFVTSFLFLIGLYAETTVPATFPVKYLCTLSDDLLMQFNIITKRGVSLEAFMAVVCWSSTYLFVRRLWNPENYGAVIEKYAADSFFGGLAAGASVIIKHMLLRSLA